MNAMKSVVLVIVSLGVAVGCASRTPSPPPPSELPVYAAPCPPQDPPPSTPDLFPSLAPEPDPALDEGCEGGSCDVPGEGDAVDPFAPTEPEACPPVACPPVSPQPGCIPQSPADMRWWWVLSTLSVFSLLIVAVYHWHRGKESR